jgi:hypothetical protein
MARSNANSEQVMLDPNQQQQQRQCDRIRDNCDDSREWEHINRIPVERKKHILIIFGQLLYIFTTFNSLSALAAFLYRFRLFCL